MDDGYSHDGDNKLQNTISSWCRECFHSPDEELSISDQFYEIHSSIRHACSLVSNARYLADKYALDMNMIPSIKNALNYLQDALVSVEVSRDRILR